MPEFLPAGRTTIGRKVDAQKAALRGSPDTLFGDPVALARAKTNIHLCAVRTLGLAELTHFVGTPAGYT